MTHVRRSSLILRPRPARRRRNAAPDAPEPAAPPKKKRTSKGRQPRVFPDFLPREEERLELNEADIPAEMLQDPARRRFFKKIGERIEMIPVQFKVIEQYQEMFMPGPA